MTSLVLVVAMPMMVLMPWVARALDMPAVVSGAWLGGTLDTSAAVVAAGELLGDAGRNAAVVVKLSQNALIGVAAFLLTVWWAMRNQTGAPRRQRQPDLGAVPEVRLRLPAGLGASSRSRCPTRRWPRPAGLINNLRTVLFAMAFVSIGLETSLGSLVTTDGGRPAAAFLGGQAFNIVVTLVAAYAFFGGWLFPLPNLG